MMYTLYVSQLTQAYFCVFLAMSHLSTVLKFTVIGGYYRYVKSIFIFVQNNFRASSLSFDSTHVLRLLKTKPSLTATREMKARKLQFIGGHHCV